MEAACVTPLLTRLDKHLLGIAVAVAVAFADAAIEFGRCGNLSAALMVEGCT